MYLFRYRSDNGYVAFRAPSLLAALDQMRRSMPEASFLDIDWTRTVIGAAAEYELMNLMRRDHESD